MSSSQPYSSTPDAQRVQYGRVSGDSIFNHPPQYDDTLIPDFQPAPLVGDANTAPAALNTHTGSSATSGASVCHVCNKTFKRRCDLNRHRRTHTRPFKCLIESCEYYKRGFPTSQERQRHMDDRHSDKPPTFKCRFKSCKYSSKRESNCKQHMEKTHGWKYDRSRQNNRTDDEDADIVVAAPVAADGTIPSTLSSIPVHGYLSAPMQAQLSSHMEEGDFILYPEQQAAAAMLGAFDGSVVYTNNAAVCQGVENLDGSGARSAPEQQEADSNSFVPWESPLTQQEEITNLIRSAVHRIDSQSSSQQSAVGQPLQQTAYPKSIGWYSPAGFVAQVPAAADHPSPTPNFAGTPHFAQTVAYTSPHTPLVAAPAIPQPIPQSWPTSNAGQLFSRQSVALQQAQNDDETAGSGIASANAAAGLQQASSPADYVDRGVKRDRDADSDEDDESERNHRPHKHPKTSGNDAIDEDHMPCPFYLTDPAYFYRGNEERFSPCHTQHRYISTLFRHLGRAAHNLVITETSASSFGIQEENRPQPQAGLCRRCWTAFHDRGEFDAHVDVGRQCARVSRSKREKYSLIKETFCSPLPGSGTPPTAGVPALQPAAPIRPDMGLSNPSSKQVQAPDQSVASSSRAIASPDIKVSPTQTQPKANVLTQGHKQNVSVGSATLVGTEFVTRSEFQGVVQRLDSLEAIVKRFGQPGAQPQGLNRQHGFPPNSGNIAADDVASLGAARSAAVETDASAHERGSLVREMDRQTIVEEDDHDDIENDHDGSGDVRRNSSSRSGRGPNEPGDASQVLAGIGEPLRTLSGLSSSSDGSSVRHVPPPASVRGNTGRGLRQQCEAQGQPIGGHTQQQQRRQQRRQHKRQHEEAETLPDTVPETLADSGYGASENKTAGQQNQDESTALASVIHSGPGASVTSIPAPAPGSRKPQGQPGDHANEGNNVDDIDDGVQFPSMFGTDLPDEFDHNDIPW